LARYLLRRAAARAVSADPWLPALLGAAGAGGLAGLGLAGQPRLHAGAAVLLPARRAGAAGARSLVARRRPAVGARRVAVPGVAAIGEIAAGAPAAARRQLRRHCRSRPRDRLSGAPVPEGFPRLSDGETHDQG